MTGRCRLSQHQIDQIVALREDQGLTYAAIAKTVGCAKSAANWLCRRDGVYHPTRARALQPQQYVRRGSIVRPFGADEDARIADMRAAGCSNSEIGRALGRSAGSVKNRFITLAWREGAAERLQAAQ